MLASDWNCLADLHMTIICKLITIIHPLVATIDWSSVTIKQILYKNIEWTTLKWGPALWPWSFGRVTWKLILKLLRVTSVLSLATFKQRGQKILSGQHFYKDQQFDLDLWQCDLKIDRGHLPSRGIHYTKSSFFQERLGLQTIPTDQQVQNIL